MRHDALVLDGEAMSKSALRREVMQRRLALGDARRREYSAAISETLLDFIAREMPRTEQLLAYRAMNSEVNIDPVFELPDRESYAPVTHHHEHMLWHRITPETRWQPGLFGVLEPMDGEIWEPGRACTVLICPLTGFDRSGNRLGMGKGCFDFWLAQHRSHIAHIIGVGFACQELDRIPSEPHDIPMQTIITEREIIHV